MGLFDGLFGGGGESAQEREAREAAERTKQLINRLENLQLDDKKIEEFLSKRADTLPELAGLYQALQEDPGLLEKLEADPRFGEIARENLEKIQEIAEEGGFTEEDMAKFREAERKSKALTSATQKSIDRKMMERGVGPGAGLTYAAQQQALQSEADRTASRMDQIALEAANRRRAALGQAADMAQSQEAQQFEQRGVRARATDSRSLRNLQGRQSSLDKNLQMKQQLANLKAQNQAGYYDSMAQLEQQKYANEMAKLSNIGKLQGQEAQFRIAGAKPEKNKAGFLGGLAGAGIGAYLASTGMGPQGAAIGYQIGSSAGNYFGADDGGVKYNDGGVSYKKGALERLSDKPAKLDFTNTTPVPKERTASDEIAAFNALQRQGRRYEEGGVSNMGNAITTSQQVARSQTPEVPNSQNYNSAETLPKSQRYEPPSSYGSVSKNNRYNNLPSVKTNKLFSSPVKFEEGGVKDNKDTDMDQKKNLQAIQKIAQFMEAQRKKNNVTSEDRLKKFKKIASSELDLETPENLLPKATPLGGIQANDGAVKMSPDDMRDMLLSEINKFACGGVKHGKKYEEGGLGAAISPADLRRMEDNIDLQALREEVESEGGYPEMEGDDFSYQSRREFEDALRMEEERDARAAERNEYAEGSITPELIEATQMLRKDNQPAPASPMPGGQPPMPAAPMDPNMMPPQAPQGAPMAPPMDPAMLPPQGAPMPPQGQMMADGGMAYEDGGEGTIIPGESFEGDQLPDRINSGEMVLNVEQQDRLNDQLQELKRLKSKERTDKMLADGTAEVNPEQQEAIMAFVRGEIDIDELPSERVVKEPSVGEPTGRMAELLGMLGKKKRG